MGESRLKIGILGHLGMLGTGQTNIANIANMHQFVLKLGQFRGLDAS